MFPIESHHFALYLQYVGTTTRFKSAVEEAINAAAWVLEVAGNRGIAQDPIIRVTLAAAC